MTSIPPWVTNGIVQRADDRLAATVLTALRAEPSLVGDRAFVTVDGGAATLYGRVHSDAQARWAEHIARRVEGIVAVDQSMFVSRPVRQSIREESKK